MYMVWEEDEEDAGELDEVALFIGYEQLFATVITD
jgi:hypothetical protein